LSLLNKFEFFTDYKTIIKTQQFLFSWFENIFISDDQKLVYKLQYFKSLIDDLHSNGSVDSGTKIQILKLIKETSRSNFTKLRRPPKLPRRRFLVKYIHLKFDLKLCSFKVFCDNIQTIDSCALKYIEHVNDVKTYLRDKNDLKIRNFLGELDVTIEANTLKDLRNAEISIKRLAESYSYRLVKTVEQLTLNRVKSTKTLLKIGVDSNFQPPLQSPTTSTPDDSLSDSLIDSSSINFFSTSQIREDFLTSIDSIAEKYKTSFTTMVNSLA
jgi:hypothetical protein